VRKAEEIQIKEAAEVEDEITGIELVKAKEVFGEAARNPDRNLITITVESGVTVRIPAPKGLVFQNGEWYVDNEIAYLRSIQNPASKFAAYIRKYGFPNVGKKVGLRLNKRGFWEVAL
jgi:hypothetical protein